MKLQLSCSDYSFPLLEHERALAVIALLGLRGVDIGLFEGHGHLQPSRELKRPAYQGAKLRGRLTAQGLTIADIFLQLHAGFSDYAVNHPQAGRRAFARDQFMRALDYVNSAGARHLTILPGITFAGATRADAVSRSADELAWRVTEAQAAKLQLAVEPHVGSLASTPERARDLIQRVPGLGLTLDYAHFTRAGIPDARIEPLTQFATHVHARTARRGRLQTPASENTIHFPRLLQALARRKFTGWIALEYVWIDWEYCNEVDVLSETLQLKSRLTSAAASLK